MPLIDQNDLPKDWLINDLFWQYFEHNSIGDIVDKFGHYWVIFDEDHFSMWLRYFESFIGTPIGRIIHNSATDCAEIILSDINLMKIRFFAKKKFSNLISQRWGFFGWGRPCFKKNQVTTTVFASVSAGFFLASKEILDKCRYKIQWSQKSDVNIDFIISNGNNDMPIPQEIDLLPWHKKTSQKNKNSVNLYSLEKRDIGWSIDGKAKFVIPIELINRIIFNASGYAKSLHSDVANRWILTGFQSKYSNSLICALEASKKVFLHGDDYIYLSDENDWYSITNKHLNLLGLSSIIDVQISQNKTYFSMSVSETFALSVGKLVGLWERAYGKVAKCKIEFMQDKIHLELSSFLEYNHYS